MQAQNNDSVPDKAHELQARVLTVPDHSTALPTSPAAEAHAYRTPERYMQRQTLATQADLLSLDCPICLTGITSSSSSSNATSFNNSSNSAENHHIILDCKHSYHSSCLADFLKLGTPLDEEHMLFSCPKCKADGLFQAENQSPTGGSGTAEPATPQPPAPAHDLRIGSISPDNMQQLVQLGLLTPVEKASLSKQLTTPTTTLATAGSGTYSCIECSSPLQLQASSDLSDPRAFTVICLVCEKEQCCSCSVEWTEEHVGISCIVFKARKQLAAADPDSRKMLAQSLPCPSCGYGIVKVAGCNKVRCAKCKLFMCWTCGQQLPRGKAGYEHFGKDGTGMCRKYAGKRASWMGDLVEETDLLEATKKQQKKPKQKQKQRQVPADLEPVQNPKLKPKRAAANSNDKEKAEQQQVERTVQTRKRRTKYSAEGLSDDSDSDDVQDDDDNDDDWKPRQSRRAVKRRR